MKRGARSLLLYGALVGLPALAVLGILRIGAGLWAPPAAALTDPAPAAADPAALPNLPLLLLQLAAILTAARILGRVFRRIGQPRVVGEMVAGILLGPTLLGWLAPGFFAFLFPVESLGSLHVLSQVGLVLFMFIVGLQLDPAMLRGKGHTAVVTSHVSIVAPFFLGAALALYLYPRLSTEEVGFAGFALFLGAAMAVTAFPVLARILTERNLLRTRVGVVTIACAAVDDVTAWCILAGVVLLVRADASAFPLWATLAGTALFVAAMVFGARRLLRGMEAVYLSRGRLTQEMLGVALLLLLLSALATEALGIHALFGAFLLGAVMPKHPGFTRELSGRLEDVTVVLLLPIFFAFTGLRTSFGLVDGAEMWILTLLIILVAVAGKFGGSALAARLTGLGWREAGALGILMNTRGLMELVILNIGLDIGVISPALFSMMVVMALVTTFMTTPVLEWIYPARLIRREALAAPRTGAYTIVLPVSLSSYGPRLLRVARALAGGGALRLYGLHLDRVDDRSLGVRDAHPDRPREALVPLVDAADRGGVELHTLAFLSHDVAGDIAEVAEARHADLVLMGWHKPILGRNILGGTVQRVMERARTDVAVLVERAPPPWDRVLVADAGGPHGTLAREMGRRLAAGGGSVTLLRLPEAPPEEPPAAWTVVEAGSERPLDALHRVAEGHDVVLLGLSGGWAPDAGSAARALEALATATGASLLVLRSADPGEEP